MEILIVDDEPLARQRLVRMIEKLEGHNIIGEAENADEALSVINDHDPDIVLLDIRMPGKDGVTLAKEISQLDCPPAIIFCTAFDQYALDAFGTTAIGYLLKPIKAEQLEDALGKAQKLNKVQRAVAQKPALENKTTRTHISAKTRRGIELIPLDDVRYFVADHKYVTVFHRNGEHLLDETLKELEEEFGSRFIRVHRNALISVKHIEAIERAPQGQYQVRLADTEQKPIISRRHVSDVKELLKLM
ncbi:MAG: response regulator transcription factor [Gammaproteobacteria bacterium]|nr:MAG: response regulator transcription factor [Gammaproteobacteria bacterium]